MKKRILAMVSVLILIAEIVQRFYLLISPQASNGPLLVITSSIRPNVNIRSSADRSSRCNIERQSCTGMGNDFIVGHN